MPISEIFAILKGSISLIPPTIKVVEKLREKDESPTLTRVVDTFANDTIEAVDKLQISIDDMRL